MRAQKLGIAIGGFGAVYLLVVAWLVSWWYVPTIRELGFQGFSKSSTWGGTTVFIVWAVSGVLGAILVALGAAVYSAIGRFRLLLFVVGSILLLIRLTAWPASPHYAILYGIGGGLILLCFLASCLHWAITRRRFGGARATAADLRLAGHVCFFIAAWGLCGILGAPVFTLRPELAEAYQTSSMVPSMATKVLVCLVLGWGFTALSQRVERHESAA